LWAEFRSGSEAAFARIYRQHARVLLTYGKKIVSQHKLAEDCLHDLFIELWERRQHLGATDSIRLYLLKALKNKLLRASARQNRLSLAGAPGDDYHFSFSFSFESELISNQLSAEQEERLKASVAGLSQNQREIIFLRFYSDLSYDQIAEVMGINYQSVKNLMFRAMRALREQMGIVILYALGVAQTLL
jgi:RNA polymerase sigma factor (sigma-70 family)